MTIIRTDHPIRRETSAEVRRGGRHRPLVVELHAGYLRIGPKGLLRTEAYMIDYEAVWHAAAKIAARERS